jgi:hypothetical protein
VPTTSTSTTSPKSRVRQNMPKIPLALIADHAVANTEDRKLYVMGGGIRSIGCITYPTTIPRLALALGFEFSGSELRPEPHHLRIEASGPSDEAFAQPLTASFTVPADPSRPDRPIYFHFVYNMENVTFQSDGMYRFSIFINDEGIGEVPLRIDTEPVIPPEVEARLKIQQAYAAYGAGDAAGAEEIFQEITTRFPSVPEGHNNLGFLVLGKREADIALEHFTRARALGFDRPELLDANVGCVYYLKGDPASGSSFFQRCLAVHLFRISAVLYGIEGDHLFQVWLNSAADYVSLMQLNAGWALLRSGQRADAARYLRAAEAADLGRHEDESGKNYSQSVEALRVELAQG